MREKKGSPRKDWKCVYVLLFSDNTVKIGVTKNLKKRIKTHEVNTHLKCVKNYATEKCSNAFLIENITKNYFLDYSKYGSEWFDIPFAKAKNFVKKTFDEIAEFQDTTDEYEKNIAEFSKKLEIITSEFLQQQYEDSSQHEKMVLNFSDYMQKNTENIEWYSKMLDESMEKTEKLLRISQYSQDMLRYVLWYFEEICKENMMYSEFERFKKRLFKVSERIQRP